MLHTPSTRNARAATKEPTCIASPTDCLPDPRADVVDRARRLALAVDRQQRGPALRRERAGHRLKRPPALQQQGPSPPREVTGSAAVQVHTRRTSRSAPSAAAHPGRRCGERATGGTATTPRWRCRGRESECAMQGDRDIRRASEKPGQGTHLVRQRVRRQIDRGAEKRRWPRAGHYSRRHRILPVWPIYRDGPFPRGWIEEADGSF